jgi:hypothetical protein
MTLQELEAVLERPAIRDKAANWDADSAGRFLARVDLLNANGLGQVVERFARSGDLGNVQGSLFEINFAAAFLESAQKLAPDVRQDNMRKDVDFRWEAAGHSLFFELKRIGEHEGDRARLQRQIAGVPEPDPEPGEEAKAKRVLESDIGRAQQDIISKAQKFTAPLQANAVNIVVVDVCELISHMMDVYDCMLVTGGPPLASQHYPVPFESVVGLFEEFDVGALGDKRRKWFDAFHQVEERQPHPREVVHGVLFLFRDPRGKPNLSFGLSGYLGWNPHIARALPTEDLTKAIHSIIPVGRRPRAA